MILEKSKLPHADVERIVAQMVSGFDEIRYSDNNEIEPFDWKKLVSNVKKITDLATEQDDPHIIHFAADEIAAAISITGRYVALRTLLLALPTDDDREKLEHSYLAFLDAVTPLYQNSELDDDDFILLIIDTIASMITHQPRALGTFLQIASGDYDHYLRGTLVSNPAFNDILQECVKTNNTYIIDVLVENDVVPKKTLLLKTEYLDSDNVKTMMQTLKINYSNIQNETTEQATLSSITIALNGLHVETDVFLSIVGDPINYLLNIPEHYADAIPLTLTYYAKHDLLPISILDYMGRCPEWQNAEILGHLN